MKVNYWPEINPFYSMIEDKVFFHFKKIFKGDMVDFMDLVKSIR
jgi:hypothetical protein